LVDEYSILKVMILLREKYGGGREIGSREGGRKGNREGKEMRFV
jgi:hypothetical protein